MRSSLHSQDLTLLFIERALHEEDCSSKIVLRSSEGGAAMPYRRQVSAAGDYDD